MRLHWPKITFGILSLHTGVTFSTRRGFKYDAFSKSVKKVMFSFQFVCLFVSRIMKRKKLPDFYGLDGRNVAQAKERIH